MGSFALSIIALACGCGRIAFDPTSDAGTSTTADAVAASPCPIDGTTIFCDDFEQADFSNWVTATNITRVTAPTRSGMGAMRAAIPVATDEAWLLAAPSQLSALPFFSLRFWVYVQADASLEQANLITLANGQNGQELTVLGFAEEYRIWRETSSAIGYPGVTMDRARWTCIELDVSVDDTNGWLELRVDGVTTIRDDVIDTRVDGDYRELSIGLPYSNFPGQGAITLYYDDVHIGTRAVGCAP